MQYIIGLDPGNKYTGYCIVDEKLKPIMFGKEANDIVMEICKSRLMESDMTEDSHIVAIERVASYGMTVGSEVFETCEWIGRFSQELGHFSPIGYVYRRDEKKYICGSPTANDATIRRALADRFAYGAPNYGKGTKSNPGFFYGFKADIWSAFAVCVTYNDMEIERKSD